MQFRDGKLANDHHTGSLCIEYCCGYNLADRSEARLPYSGFAMPQTGRTVHGRLRKDAVLVPAESIRAMLLHAAGW